jgi:hypothetical protein
MYFDQWPQHKRLSLRSACKQHGRVQPWRSSFWLLWSGAARCLMAGAAGLVGSSTGASGRVSTLSTEKLLHKGGQVEAACFELAAMCLDSLRFLMG